MLKKLLSLLFLLFAAAFAGNAQSFNKPKMDSLFAAIDINQKGMGSLAITQNGDIVYQHAIGKSNIAGGPLSAADTKTRYRIGSISKMFTATMVFQLIEEGKLSIDAKLSLFYPQVGNADKITIGQMLGHRSGLHNFTNDPAYLTYLAKPHTQAEMLAIIAASKPDFEPDGKAEYSNTNFVLLGYIVEKLTKTTYAQALKQRIVARVGLPDTYYGGKIVTANHEAQSYKFNGGWQPDTETDMSIPGGAGAIVSTPADLVKFVDALFTGKLINPAHLAMMQNIRENYGMGMFIMPFYARKSYGHTGGIDGFQSMLCYFPAEKAAFAYCTNGVNYPMNDVMIGVLSVYFNQAYKIPDFKAFFNLQAADLDKYLGVYSSVQVPLKITVTKNGNTLVAQAAGQSAFPLAANGDDKFSFEASGILLEFKPQTGQMILKQGGGNFTFTKDK